MRDLAAVSLIALVAATSASAQTGTGNPAGVAPGTPQSAAGTPAVSQPNQNDLLFAQVAAIGGKAEVDFGQLAEQKGHSQAVKDFARQMGADHGKADQQLAQLSQAAHLPLPSDLDEEHKAMRRQLDKLSGGDFDLAYIRGQVAGHQKTAQLLEWEIGSGQDPQLKNFAAQILPVVLRHLQTASGIEYQLTATASTPVPPGASGKPPTR